MTKIEFLKKIIEVHFIQLMNTSNCSSFFFCNVECNSLVRNVFLFNTHFLKWFFDCREHEMLFGYEHRRNEAETFIVYIYFSFNK